MSFEDPEVLEVGRGDAMPSEPPTPESERRRRALVLGAGVTAGVVALGAAAWGVHSFVSTGPQPAEALPASTLAYVALDIDPSGPQKIEAYKFLRKFPAIREQLDLEDDDLRRTWFEEFVDASDCTTLDYEEDVAPWLGSRAAAAAVDLGGETPTPVVALEVTDDDAARDGLEEVRRCLYRSPVELGSDYGTETDGSEEGGEGMGWALEDGWAILAASADEARQVVDATAAADLAGDEEFTSWMDAVGSPGIVTMYAAPEAGQALLDSFGHQLDGMAALGGDMSAQVATPDFAEDYAAACEDPSSTACQEFLETWDQGVQMTAPSPADRAELPDDVKETFEGFTGAAATLGFEDGALQLSAAGDAGVLLTADVASGAGDLAGDLPDSTVAAVSTVIPEGWADKALDQLAWGFGGREQLVASMEQDLGLSLPEDLETLLGERVAVALGPLDASTFEGDVADVPVGVVVDGDADAIRGVLDTMAQHGGFGPQDVAFLESSAHGDLVAFGAHREWREALVEDGDLADTESYRRVIRHGSDAAGVVFVDFDGDDDWLVGLVDTDEDKDNLAPLDAFGLSVWTEGDVAHTVWRLTTD